MRRYGVILLVVILAISVIYVNTNYLFSPIFFPKGNIAQYDYSFTSFKKPVLIEAVKWDIDGNQEVIHYVTDEQGVKRLLMEFDKAKKLEGYSNEKYLSEAPFPERGAEYNINFKQVERWEGDIAQGRILINFTFFENNNVFDISGSYFYELTETFKGDILNVLSKTER